MDKMRAFVTLLTSDSFLPGILVLQKSLQKYGSHYKLFCLTTNNLSEQTHIKLIAAEITPISIPNLPSQYQTMYHKLYIWNLVQYEKIVYLDAGQEDTTRRRKICLTISFVDLLIRANIDELFDVEGDFAAAPDVCLGFFNSGVMVIKPSEDVFQQLIAALSTESYDKGDQGLLNVHFKDWFLGNQSYRLHPKYNMPFILCANTPHYSEYIEKKTPIKIIHFWGSVKPWHSSRQFPFPLSSFANNILNEYDYLLNSIMPKVK